MPALKKYFSGESSLRFFVSSVFIRADIHTYTHTYIHVYVSINVGVCVFNHALNFFQQLTDWVESLQFCTLEAWSRSQGACGVRNGQSGIWTGFSRSSSVFPLHLTFHQCLKNLYIHLPSALCLLHIESFIK